MPLVSLDQRHKTHLEFLSGLSAGITKEFCRIAVDFIKRGSRTDLYQKAGKKLGASPEVVKQSIECLSHLLSECARLSLSEEDFADSLLGFNYPDHVLDILRQTYAQHCSEIRSVLQSETVGFDLPHYSDLEWRLDVQVASRSLRGQVYPHYVLKLDTTGPTSGVTEGNKPTTQFLEADPLTLKHVCSELENAMSELQTSGVRRVMRNIR